MLEVCLSRELGEQVLPRGLVHEVVSRHDLCMNCREAEDGQDRGYRQDHAGKDTKMHCW